MVGKNEEEEKKLPLDLHSDQVIMLDDPITSQTAKSIGRSIYKILGNFSPTPP